MNTEAKFETDALYAWDKLLFVMWKIGCFLVKLNGNKMLVYEPECLDLRYDINESLIIAAVDHKQLPSYATGDFFNRGKTRAVLKGCLGKDVGAIEDDGVIYFRIHIQHSLQQTTEYVLHKS